jgi:uncharacterized protein
MTPTLADEVFVYCSFGDFRLPADLTPICTFREAEGLTAIVERRKAEAVGIAFEFPCRLITLNVHSSLEAVGFMALISDALARAKIPCNGVSAFHHDHLFVPDARAAEALQVLRNLAAATGSG